MSEKKTVEFHSTNVDLFLALIITFGLPFLCSYLFNISGAFFPLLVYYGFGCIFIVKWRKGSLDYRKPSNWAPTIFLIVLIAQIITQITAVSDISYSISPQPIGILLTVLIWSPLNALMEQLLWIYIYDAFAVRDTKKQKKTVFIILGFICYLTFIGLIHAVFWAKFLPAFNKNQPYYTIFFVFQFIVSIGYIPLYKKTNSMLPIALIHLIADVTLILAGGYSIGPDLFVF